MKCHQPQGSNERKDIAMDAETAVGLILYEFSRATALDSPLNSAHEGYAVILEELDELKAEVWKKPINRDREVMAKEAIQVAAMALRFLVDVC
jgi:hypothetical protein